MWGVVRGIDAYVFDRTGAAVAPADPGTVVEIAAVRTSATDRVAICRFRGRTEPAGLMLMRLDDLAVRSGAFTRADSDLVSLLVRQAVLTGEIGMQKERVAENGSTGNPHAANYRKTRDALREFLKKAQTLKGRFDASRGSERAELVDRLRMMKQEEVQLSQQFTEAKARFDQWNTTHASGGDEPAEIKQMKAELAKIESDIKQFDR